MNANAGQQYQANRASITVSFALSKRARPTHLGLYGVVMNMCAAGNHDPSKKYGICGILTAIFCFPCGLICLLYVSAPSVSSLHR